MTQFKKILFLDADTLIYKNIDHLFGPEYPMFTGEFFWRCADSRVCVMYIHLLVYVFIPLSQCSCNDLRLLQPECPTHAVGWFLGC